MEANNEQRKRETQEQKCERCMEDGLEPDEYCKYYGEPCGCNSPKYGEYPSDALLYDNNVKYYELLGILDDLFADCGNDVAESAVLHRLKEWYEKRKGGR